MTPRDPYFTFRDHPRGRNDGASYPEGERYSPRIAGRRDLVAGLIWVVLCIVGLIVGARWVTGHFPTFIGEAQAESRVEPEGYLFGDGFEDWCCAPLPLPCDQDPNAEGCGAPPPDPCDHPLVMPEGWVRKTITWAQLFTPRDGAPVPTYPNSNGFPVPIGADKGTYVTARFVAEPMQAWNLFWDGAQANPPEGYRTARPADSMFLSISQCPGDFRIKLGFDPCAKNTNTGSLLGNSTGVVSAFACPLVAGAEYWITVAPVNPVDGLTPGEHTCRPVPSSEAGCDVQARQTAQ
jgi:hypothetical protein